MNIQNISLKSEPLRADSIRIPAELRSYLRAEARKNTRSYSGEVVHRLEASRQADQQHTQQKGQQP
ncbi:Arc family DNA-binding protein [Acidovorax sp. LjRoot38]|uniref:Arc family DNA-binding protein n=1 Tax=Acidovorax sp. LjRoot38 TaxID=3342327 RepID=UPI003F5048D2